VERKMPSGRAAFFVQSTLSAETDSSAGQRLLIIRCATPSVNAVKTICIVATGKIRAK